jgi:hypothetical protein
MSTLSEQAAGARCVFRRKKLVVSPALGVTLSIHAALGMLGRQDILFSSRSRCVSLC